MNQRFCLCCGLCNQPLSFFETDDRLLGLACPEVLSPVLCQHLNHSIYRTSLPAWLSGSVGMDRLMHTALLAFHINGRHLKVFERFPTLTGVSGRKARRSIVRDLTVIYGLNGQGVSGGYPVLITHECDVSKHTLRLIDDFQGSLLVGRARA